MSTTFPLLFTRDICIAVWSHSIESICTRYHYYRMHGVVPGEQWREHSAGRGRVGALCPLQLAKQWVRPPLIWYWWPILMIGYQYQSSGKKNFHIKQGTVKSLTDCNIACAEPRNAWSLSGSHYSPRPTFRPIYFGDMPHSLFPHAGE